MTQLPPPRLPDEPLSSPPEPASRSMLRAGAIALLASTLVVGGIAVGSQFVSADSPSVDDQPVDAEPVAEKPVEEDAGDANADDPFAEFENCLFGTGVIASGPIDLGDIDPHDFDLNEIDDLIGELFDGSVEACTSIAPEGLEEEFAAWEEFDTCLDAQLGFDETFGLPGSGSVMIDIPSEDGLDLSIYDFGDDDGSITITKSADDISVSTDGDVNELDDFSFGLDDFSFGEMDDEFAAAHEACADLLPDGVDIQELTPLGGGFKIFAEPNND